MHICLWSVSWSPDDGTTGSPDRGPAEAALLLADLAPRLRVEPPVIWADGRGLDAAKLAGVLLERLADAGIEAHAGVAAVPVAAELAARLSGDAPAAGPTPFLVKERTGWGHRRSAAARANGAEPAAPARVVAVPRGEEREWLGRLPVALLGDVVDRRLRTLLDGVGIATAGELAALEREAVEVRFGAAAVAAWRLARGDDRRVLFQPVPPERPHGAIDFVDYVLTDPARLVFTANALLGPLCDRLAARGEHARALRLVLPLANGEAWERTIRPARPTASRETWLRLIRGVLDRITVPDAVTGMTLEVGATEPAGVRQGDLFDRGFATAAAVEAAIARLAELQAAPVEVTTNADPRVERRAELRAASCEPRITTPTAALPPTTTPSPIPPPSGLALQLLPEPRRLLVETVRRRDHEAPVRLRDRGGWREVVIAAGPDRISGGRWEGEPYAREYFRCVTDEGVPLWVYRDGRDGEWFLHGWWD